MGFLGPISKQTRLQIVRATHGGAAGLPGAPLDRLAPSRWSLVEALFEHGVVSPDLSFLTYYDDEQGKRETWTYGRAARRVHTVARFMREALGVGPGDAVAIADLRSHPDTILLCFAAWACGAMGLVVDMRDDRRRHQQILRHAGVRAVFARDREEDGTSDNYLTRMTAVAGDLGIPHVVQLGGSDRRAAHWLSVVEDDAADPLAFDVFPPHTEAFLAYSTGPGGSTQGVLLSHAILRTAESLAAHQGFGRGEVFYLAEPLHRLDALVAGVLLPCLLGATVVFDRRFSPGVLLERVEDEGVTTLFVAPPGLRQICAHLRTNGLSLAEDFPDVRDHLKRILTQGRLPAATAREVLESFGLCVSHGFGTDELQGWGTLLPSDLTEDEYRRFVLEPPVASVGAPLRGLSLGVQDPDSGALLGPGQRGELVAAGPAMMLGYHRHATANEKTFAGGVLHTGVEAIYETLERSDGTTRPMFSVLGRMAHRIHRDGAYLSPVDIECDLLKCPGVRRCLVLGFTHDFVKQEVGAVVVTDGTTDVNEPAIWRHFLELGYPWERTPKVVRFVLSLPEGEISEDEREAFHALFDGLESVPFTAPEGFPTLVAP